MSVDSTYDDDTFRLQCRHIKPDGHRCGSPALRDQHLCYYHGRSRHAGARQPQVRSLADRKNATFNLPSPADLAERSGIQLAIAEVLHKIAHNEIDPRRAGLLLYGLQIASMTLPKQSAPKQPAAREESVDQLTLHPELGALAPEAEYTGRSTKSSIELLWDKYERDHGLHTPSAHLAQAENAQQEPTQQPRENKAQRCEAASSLLEPPAKTSLSLNAVRANAAPCPCRHRSTNPPRSRYTLAQLTRVLHSPPPLKNAAWRGPQ